MKRFVVLAWLCCAGCSRCAEEPQKPVAMPADTDGIEAAASAKVGLIYHEALDRAKHEITAESAADRLDEIERAIDIEGDRYEGASRNASAH